MTTWDLSLESEFGPYAQGTLRFATLLKESKLRQSPGSEGISRQALMLLPDLQSHDRILNVGYGTGLQTLELARLTPALITAIDVHPAALTLLAELVEEEGLTKRIEIVQSPFDLSTFRGGEFDLVWAEGVVPQIGLRETLMAWRRVLKPGGAIVFSDYCWVGDQISKQVGEFWRAHYPDMKSLTDLKTACNAIGFDIVDAIVIPSEDWEQSFSRPLSRLLSNGASDFFELESKLIEIHEKHPGVFEAVLIIARPRVN